MRKRIAIGIYILVIAVIFALDIPVYVEDGELSIPLEGAEVRCQYTVGEITSFITDETGFVLITLIDDASFPIIITSATPGYDDVRIELTEQALSTSRNPLVISMGLSMLVEGEELVVEGKRSSKAEEKSGVALVRTSEEMKSTAQVGVVEDIMNSVATLPGVGFKLGMNVEPSIRGGYPKEMGVTFDGVYLLEPYFWDGMVSILSPYMVDTVKLSTGVFSSRYGQGCSGLLDATSTKISDAKKITINISTISADIAAEVPLGMKNELFVYGHATDLSLVKYSSLFIYNQLKKQTTDDDMLLGALSSIQNIVRMPYIYSLYAKWETAPLLDLRIVCNGLFSVDGYSIESKVIQPEGSPYREYSDEYSDYSPYNQLSNSGYSGMQGVGSLGINYLFNPKTLLNLLVSYTGHRMNSTLHNYYLDVVSSYFYEDEAKLYVGEQDKIESFIKNTNQTQAKVETEIELPGESLLSIGLEEVIRSASSEYNCFDKQMVFEKLSIDYLPAQGPTLITDISSPGNTVFNSNVFTVWNFGTENSLLQGEAGVRALHYYILNNEQGFEKNSIPVFNPRATISYIPWKDTEIFNYVTFSAGSGLFSSLNEAAYTAGKEQYKNIELVPDTVWLLNIGSDLAFINNYSIRFEAYAKKYFSRFYMYADERNSEQVIYYAKNDGQGFLFGADLMLEKKISSVLDGYISYSFLFARFYNPVSAQYDSQTTTTGDPLGIWYYPMYHSFHTVHYVLNFRLKNDAAISLNGSLVSGTPQKKYIDKSQEFIDGTCSDPGLNDHLLLELYSDTERGFMNWPLDIRFSKKGLFKKNPKYSWEWYVAVENITGLIRAAVNYDIAKKHNLYYMNSEWTIGERPNIIDIGFFPIPSFGVKFTL
ncbi:MAG TPA: Plug domain-containing protein [Treponemataceae bacterium]|jgi:hypothetical protein|nr:Plug domain-containing protein [Treponemataceae bacterium]